MTRKAQRGKWLSALGNALALEERLVLLRTRTRTPVPARRLARARRTILEWKQRKPFEVPGAFAGRLKELAIDEETLAHALAMSASRKTRRFVLEKDLWHTYHTLAMADSLAPGSVVGTYHGGFAALVQPLLDDAFARLRVDVASNLSGVASPVFDIETALAQACADAYADVCRIIEKTCLLELRIAKLRGQLDGRTAQERYQSYIDLLGRQSCRRAFFLEYPVLLEAVSTRLGFWYDNTSAFLARLLKDADDFGACMPDLAGPPRLQSWKSGEGDSHCRGKSVITVMFEGDRRIVYKPRSLAIDAGFNAVVAWLNGKLAHLPLRTAKVIDRGTHGWCEFIRQADAPSLHDVADYYRRQGKMLAFFYGLHSSDLHNENLIASGADPVYVDLETLFHPIQDLVIVSEAGRITPTRPMTVIDTMILPMGHSMVHEDRHIDISALASMPDQLFPSVVAVEAGTDRMHIGVVDRVFNGSSHLPRHEGKIVGPLEYLDQITAGFSEVYLLLMRERQHLMSDEGLPTYFAQASCRSLFRGTAVYWSLVQKSLHPDYLRSALDRRALFERLYHPPGHQNAYVNTVLDVELRDLHQLDVPYFHRGFNEEAFRDSTDREVAGLSMPSPRALAFALLERLGESDHQAQLALIESALGRDAAVARTHRRSGMPKVSGALAGAITIADTLREISVDSAGDRYWMCQSVFGESVLRTTPGLLNLYDGQLGIALFFGALSRLSRRADDARIAIESLDTVRRWSDGGRRGFSTCGVFDGAMGYAYTLANLGVCLEREDLVAEAFEWLQSFEPSHVHDGADVMSGAAGCIVFLAQLLDGRLQSVTPGAAVHVRRLLAHFADVLLREARPQAVGIGWPVLAGQPALAGFSHGNAGFIAALYVAAKALDRPDCRQAAQRALLYENAQYSEETGLWRDLRVGATAHGAINGWCNGAAGILLGREMALQTLAQDDSDRPKLVQDVVRARLSMRQSPACDNDSLCHGGTGNRDILAIASRSTSDPRHDRDLDSTPTQRNSWCCGDVRRSDLDDPLAAPGLLVGIAGVGFGLLREAAPDHVPAVLRLQVGIGA